jgi:hypothetical protein
MAHGIQLVGAIHGENRHAANFFDQDMVEGHIVLPASTNGRVRRRQLGDLSRASRNLTRWLGFGKGADFC